LPQYTVEMWVTDFTHQMSWGPRLGQKLFLCFDEDANVSLCNAAVPAFEAFKSVSTPIAAFNYPSVNDDFPAFDTVISAMSGKSTK